MADDERPAPVVLFFDDEETWACLESVWLGYPTAEQYDELEEGSYPKHLVFKKERLIDLLSERLDKYSGPPDLVSYLDAVAKMQQVRDHLDEELPDIDQEDAKLKVDIDQVARAADKEASDRMYDAAVKEVRLVLDRQAAGTLLVDMPPEAIKDLPKYFVAHLLSRLPDILTTSTVSELLAAYQAGRESVIGDLSDDNEAPKPY